MGNLINSRETTTNSTTELENTNLKLEAQKVKDFSGDFGEWPKWKSRTKCAFAGSGYEKVLTDPRYAVEHPQMNKVVYSQLSAATVDGNAHHLVKQHDDVDDGWGAWQSLCEWYDGDVVQSETADELRSRLEALKLGTGTPATQYINKFLTWHADMAKIPGEGLSKTHGVYLFLKNITDPDYKATVQFCRNNNADLMACVSAVRKTERDLLRQRAEKRKFRQHVRRARQEQGYDQDSEGDEQPRSRKRKSRRNNPDKHKPRRINAEVTPNHKGQLYLPNHQWRNLSPEDKAFFQSWNAAIKHGESTKDLKPPEGITIVNRPRRLDSKDANVDEPSKKKKRISFNLEDNENDSD